MSNTLCSLVKLDKLNKLIIEQPDKKTSWKDWYSRNEDIYDLSNSLPLHIILKEYTHNSV